MSRIFIFVIATMLIASTLASPRGFLVPKPGTCPEPTGVGLCADSCKNDMNCPGLLKCCTNGCGALDCAEPIFPPPIIIPQA